jgi:signal transduction histidine kinase
MRQGTLFPSVVLVFGVTISFLLFGIVRDAVEDAAQARFDRRAGDAKNIVENRIQFYADVLYGVKALIASQGPINRLQFHNYVQSLDLPSRYPGFDVVNFMQYVPASDKHRFEEAVRSDTSLDPNGYPNFAIKPPGNRPEYYVIVYVEPMAGFESSFGLDVGANPRVSDPRPLLALLHLARDSGNMTASGVPLRIKGPQGQHAGLAFRLPVYRGGMPTSNVEGRRAAFIGSVGAGFNVDNLMKGVLDPETARYMHFRFYDAGPASAPAGSDHGSTERLLYDSSRPAAALAGGPDENEIEPALFTRILPIEVGGRIWQVHFRAPKHAIMDGVEAILPWTVLGGGLLSSVLLFGMFYSLASSRSRAVELANEMTRDLRASTEQLQAMSRQLVDVQESERRQIARELHDRVGQNLTALSISLDIMKTQIGESGNAALHTRLGDAAMLLESTAGSIENVMSELRPPMLDDYGLLPALQWYGNEFWRRTGIRVSVDGDEQMERVPQTSEIALFRIAQEALNNVAKHAHARHVDIALARNGSHVVMSVSDDGMGFDAAPAMASRRRRPGLGMVTMRERTQAVGGQFEIGPAPGRGARVVVRVPC